MILYGRHVILFRQGQEPLSIVPRHLYRMLARQVKQAQRLVPGGGVLIVQRDGDGLGRGCIDAARAAAAAAGPGLANAIQQPSQHAGCTAQDVSVGVQLRRARRCSEAQAHHGAVRGAQEPDCRRVGKAEGGCVIRHGVRGWGLAATMQGLKVGRRLRRDLFTVPASSAPVSAQGSTAAASAALLARQFVSGAHLDVNVCACSGKQRKQVQHRIRTRYGWCSLPLLRSA
jgi:hypothetical protein